MTLVTRLKWPYTGDDVKKKKRPIWPNTGLVINNDTYNQGTRLKWPYTGDDVTLLVELNSLL